MFKYNIQELLSSSLTFINKWCPVGSTRADHLSIRAEFDVLIEQFQECTTPEQFQQCLQLHMFSMPWSWTIFPFFEEYEPSGSKDPVEIVLDDGSVIQCNLEF